MTAMLPARPDEAAVWVPGEPSAPSLYRSTRRLAQLVMVGLAVAAVTRAVAVAAALADYRFVDNLLDTPVVLDRWVLSERLGRSATIGWLALGSQVATAVLFVVWIHRTYANLTSLGARGQRFGTGWAVGAWFVPFLNLVRPKQIVDDTWRASDPDGSVGEQWTTRAVPGFVHLWWGLFVAAGVLTWTSADSTDATDAHADLRLLALSHVVAVAAAVLAIVVVARLSDRQALRAGVLNGADASSENLVRSRRWAVGGAVVVSAIGFLTATAVIPTGTTGVDIDGRGEFVNELESGDCWLDPGLGSDVGELLTVSVVNCGARHDFEVIATPEMALDEADDPTNAVLQSAAMHACAEAFIDRFAGSALARGLDVAAIWPAEQSWDLGDRWLSCSVYRVDGTSLTAPLL